MNSILLPLFTAVSLLFGAHQPLITPTSLSQVRYSLANRYADTAVNGVFSDNILLTIAYLSGRVKQKSDINWTSIKSQGESQFVLKPGESFAFHDAILEKYQSTLTQTTNAHFNAAEGFKSDGYLIGDGVCHLASFMYVAAKAAGLAVEAPTSHDFAAIPNVDKKDGVSIFSENTAQNLYITNTLNKPIAFVFSHKEDTLSIRVEKML